MSRRPSAKRREELRKDEGGTYILNNLVPLERYYAIADTLLMTFEEANDKSDLDNAYLMGKRFYRFCAEVLPSHDYYGSSRSDLKKMQRKNLTDLAEIADKLELIVELMDLQEIERVENETRLKLEKKEQEKRQKLAKAKSERNMILQRHNNFNTHQSSSKSSRDLGTTASMSIEEKLSLLSRVPKDANKASTTTNRTTVSQSTNDVQHINLHNSSLAPSSSLDLVQHKPMPPALNPMFHGAPHPHTTAITSDVPIVTPPLYDTVTDETRPLINPPNYHQIVQPHNTNAFRRTPFNDPGKNAPPSPEDNLIPMKELTAIYRQEFDALKAEKQVEVYALGTFQGRITSPGRDSTNGCAVISPLVAITYLNSPSPGMTDSTIESVIDETSPPILSKVRSKLGLPSSALIIPSDVHDYLVDIKVLTQDMFVGVCGGNLLDPKHVEVLLKMLKTGTEAAIATSASEGNGDEKKDHDNSHRKIAAALFFHEHVVSILKLTHANGNVWYDLIDSLPASLPRKNARDGNTPGATRTRCKDIRSLESTLRWYACSKFTEDNRGYIDHNLWDDVLCDFDPRVFQAFVWIDSGTH